MQPLLDAVLQHVNRTWPNNTKRTIPWRVPPISTTVPRFSVCEIAPASAAEPWVYVTVGASTIASSATHERLEFVILAEQQDLIHVEHLAMVTNFHADQRHPVHLGKIIAIGRPWADGSPCDHFLVSLPYYQGPDFEHLVVERVHVRFLWLTPITAAEAAFARANGAEALEAKLEAMASPVVERVRTSVV